MPSLCSPGTPRPDEHPALRAGPAKLFVETTTRCNLRCRMCVKQTVGNGVVEGDLSPEVFAALAPALPSLEALVLSGIGEPLLHPGLEGFVRAARRQLPAEAWVGFQTNGLLLDDARAASLVDAGVDRVCVSLDSVAVDPFRRIREGGDVGAVSRALGALRRAKASEPRLRVGIEFVAMRENVAELPAALRWAAARGADFALVTQVLPYEESLIGEAAYDPNTDAAVRYFEPWRERARSEGIDLDRYFKVLWKYRKDEEDERVIEFVERAKREAHERDLFVNVQKLLERDAEWLYRVEGIFREARRVAAEIGLGLELPEVVPTSERRCRFIEEGAAFVSWDGRVHPCYFLWHEYRCFINGREKFVRPKVFGDVRERPLLSIWNDEAFRSFRSHVLGYDYPFCSDCNLAKCCDYVKAEEFEQDCFINAEPCGDCLWCKGLFQCLQ